MPEIELTNLLKTLICADKCYHGTFVINMNLVRVSRDIVHKIHVPTVYRPLLKFTKAVATLPL